MKTDKSKKLAIIGKKKYLSDGIKSNEADSKIERDQVKTSSAGAERSDSPHKGGALEGMDQMTFCL